MKLKQAIVIGYLILLVFLAILAGIAVWKDTVEFIEVPQERVEVPFPTDRQQVCLVNDEDRLVHIARVKPDFAQFLEVCHGFVPCRFYSDNTYEVNEDQVTRGFGEAMARMKYGC